MLSKDGPKWNQVVRRVVKDAINHRVLCDHSFDRSIPQHHSVEPLPKHSGHVRTVFHFIDVKGDLQNHQQKTWSPNAHQKRSIDQQMRQCHEVLQSQVKAQKRILVQEVFSPPRFTPVAQQHGFKGASYDIKNGYDLTTAADRKRVEAALESNPPELLVLCPHALMKEAGST